MITQGKRVKEQPELVQSFIDGTMEGLKYSYLEPDKTNEIFLEMVPEAGQQERDRKTNRLSLLINNAMGIVPSVQDSGLGYHDTQTMQKTIDTLGEPLKWKEKPDPQKVTTNQFVGKVKLTPAEWEQARQFAKDFLNLKSS
jgi:ABC-type nitrate/sulfonate/bicarbonate transport system substrate-binding protein